MLTRARLAWLLPILVACEETSPRPQVLLTVDFDMPLVAQLTAEMSRTSAVDTVRIDVYRSDRELLEHRVFSLNDPASLPLELGIASEASSDGYVWVRIRVFDARHSSAGHAHGTPTVDPFATVTVDRLVLLALPTEGIESVGVVLHGDCMGVPAQFDVGDGASTCSDQEQPTVAPDDELTGGLSASVAGTWPLAAITPCADDAPHGTRCVPGGMTILGDPALSTPSADESSLVAVPLRAVHLRPFFMDQIELTVGQLRELVADGYDGPMPQSPDGTPELEHCSWADVTLADLPINCISVEAAEALCQWRGGTLPTEAQWEYAARGRDELRPYVWGSSPPNCCLTAMDRGAQNCPGIGPEAVVSHTEGLTCVGDVSRDGLYDLNGNVAELVRDSLAGYDESCWIGPRGRVLEDPVCEGTEPRGARGGAWSMSFGEASLASRRPYSVDASHGFRCVFDAGP